MSDIENIIKCVDTKSATGVDTISSKLVKMSPDFIAEPLEELRNTTVIQSSIFPSCEKVATVTPAYKKWQIRQKELQSNNCSKRIFKNLRTIYVK